MIKVCPRIFSKFQVGMILGLDEDDLTPLYLETTMKYGEDYVLLRDVNNDYSGELYELYFPIYENDEEPDSKVIDIVGEVFLSESGLERIAKKVNNINANYLKEKFKKTKQLNNDLHLYSSVGNAMVFTIVRDFAQNELDKDIFYIDKISGIDQRR